MVQKTGSTTLLVALVLKQGEVTREDVARAFRVSSATVGRVVTRHNEGGLRAVADYGRAGGWTVVTPKLEAKLAGLFEQGAGPRAAHQSSDAPPSHPSRVIGIRGVEERGGGQLV